jgi:hypothetical protein
LGSRFDVFNWLASCFLVLNLAIISLFGSNIWQLLESYSTRSSYYVPPRGASAEDNMLQTVPTPRYTKAIDEVTTLDRCSFRFRLRYFNLNSCLATATLIQIPRLKEARVSEVTRFIEASCMVAGMLWSNESDEAFRAYA